MFRHVLLSLVVVAR